MDLTNLKELLVTNYGVQDGYFVSHSSEVFNDKNLIQLLEEFVATNSPIFIPLKKITINKRAVSHSNFRDIHREISSNLNNISSFQNKFNIDVGVALHLSTFDAEEAEDLSSWLIEQGIDFVDFIFTYPNFNESEAHSFIASFGDFCHSSILRNPRIRLVNFPFCFVPVSQYKHLYKHIVSPLKGNIFYQRQRITEIRNKFYPYFKTCQNCRCKLPCYTYTDISRFPQYEMFLSPRSQHTVVFVGGSLLPEERINDPDIVYVSPVEQGDMFTAILEGFTEAIWGEIKVFTSLFWSRML